MGHLHCKWVFEREKLITERLTLSLQTIYHFVLFIHFFVSNRRPSARPLQLSCRLLVRSIDVVWKAQMRVVDAAARNTAKVDVLVGLANVEHFGALVSRLDGKKKSFIVVEMINCIKMKSKRENSKIAFFFFVPFENGIRYWQISMIAMISI